MKTFEERYTAWLDGKLNEAELASFEAELERHPEAAADREDVLRLGNLLRRSLPAARLANEDFFNHQLRARIDSEDARSGRGSLWPRVFRWSLPNLAWAGVCSLLLAFLSYETLIRGSEQSGAPLIASAMGPTAGLEAPYSAEILQAGSDEPDISVTPVHSEKEKVTVIWLDGLDYLPASYHLQ